MSKVGSIPVQLLNYCTRNHLENPLRVYLYLKYTSGNGVLLHSRELEIQSAVELEWSRRTIRDHLKRLTELNWISKDKEGRVFIRGYQFLSRYLKLRFTATVEMREHDLFKLNYKPYLSGAEVGYISKKKLAIARRSGSIKPDSPQYLLAPQPLSLRLLQDEFNLTPRELLKRLKKAQECGYIRIISCKETTSISPSELKMLQRNNPYDGCYPRYINGKVVLVHPNRYAPTLKYMRWKK
ncbi:MAG: hypothetical protein HWD92_09150 [Flavobacteriia bacterium]|nr:hypothetical protein [Flavobacteriia bacterium]